jgi:hypothetical protein
MLDICTLYSTSEKRVVDFSTKTRACSRIGSESSENSKPDKKKDLIKYFFGLISNGSRKNKKLYKYYELEIVIFLQNLLDNL